MIYTCIDAILMYDLTSLDCSIMLNGCIVMDVCLLVCLFTPQYKMRDNVFY